MGNNTKALKSGFWYILSNMAVRGMALITTPIFSRLLTHEQYGQYSNFNSWTNIAVILVTMRMEASLISAKFDFKDKLDQYNRSLIALTTLMTVVWALVLNIFSGFFTEQLQVGILYANLILLYCFAHGIVNLFQINERFHYRYKRSVLVSVVIAVSSTVVSILLVLTMQDKFAGRVFGHVIPLAVITCVLLYLFFKKSRSIDPSVWPYALKISLPYVPHLMSLQVLNSVDRIMITRICGAADNAMYTIAYTCGHMVTLLMTSMNGAFAPWLAEQLHEGRTDETRRVSRYYVLLFSVLAVFMMLLAPEILLIMGGKSYLDAKYVMPPVAMGCVCQFIYTLYVNVEQFKKKTVWMAVASCGAALLNYGLNALLIPRYGYIAAAYTTLAGYLFLLIAHFFIVCKLGEQHTFDNRFIILLTCVMFLTTLGINYLYDYSPLRYIIIGIAGVILAITLYWKRKFVWGIVKRILH